MSVDLTMPLEWKTATGDAAKMLEELQPNILKAHARDHFSALFLRFSEAPDAMRFLASLVPLMKSAKTHLTEVERFKTEGVKGSPYVGTGLTAAGYRFLQIEVPQDESFRLGMRAQETREKLNDPPRSTFDNGYHDEIHAVVIVGDAEDAPMTARRNEVLALIPSTISVVAEETDSGGSTPTVTESSISVTWTAGASRSSWSRTSTRKGRNRTASASGIRPPR